MMNEENNNNDFFTDQTLSNKIIEIEENTDINNTLYDIDPESIKKETEEVKLESKHNKEKKPLSKKKKITIIVILSILLVIILGIIIYLLIIKKDKKTSTSNEPLVLIEKDNYVYKDGTLIFKNKGGEEIGSYKCNNENAEYCYVAYYSVEDSFDTTKHVYEDGKNILTRSDIINDTYVFIYDNNKKEDGVLTLYNIKENKSVGTYKLVKEFSEDKVIIEKEDNNYNIISFGDEVKDTLSNNYDFIGYIKESKNIVVSTNNNYMLLDMEGKEVSKSVPGVIKNFNDENISVLINNSKYIYDYKGNKIVDTGYDYISFVDKYVLALDGKKMYVYASDGTKMNIDPLKIKSDEYNTKLIFNEELRQTGKETPFEAFIKDNNLKIQIDEDITSLNLNEGILNKNYDYVNYFDGKLYFYSDKGKTDLIGTYTCTNKNTIYENTKYYDSCYVAEGSYIIGDTQNSYFMPIYNKTFAFITDHDYNPNGGNVIVWNLKTNKKVVNYLNVDTGYREKEGIIKHVDTAGTLLVAKNTKESYGVVNIGTNSINGVIPFGDDNNKNIEVKYLGKDILMKRSDGSYHLYDSKGTEITKNVSTKYEIISYNSKYLLVKNEDKYLIYSLNGSIISSEFKYIIMENTYYIGVDTNSKLGVYTYDSKTNLIKENISLGDTNYSENIKHSLTGNIVKIKYSVGGEEKNIEVSLG